MKLKFLLTVSMLGGFIFQLNAQDIPVLKLPTEILRAIKKEKEKSDTLNWIIKRSGANNLKLNQGTLSNWAAGGDDFTLSINNYFNYFIYYKKQKHSWDSNLDLYFGLMQSSSVGTRKNDDRIDLLTKYGYNFDGNWYLSGLFNFRSQFFDGYTYNGDQATFSSTLLSPAYFILSAGFDYKPNDELSIFISPLTFRSVYIANDYLANKGVYGVEAGRHFNKQFGLFSSIVYHKAFTDDFSYKGRLDLFSDYTAHPENIDIFMTNAIQYRINKFLSLTYNLDLIYDDDVKLFGKDKSSPALQVKSLVGLGFVIKLDTKTVYASEQQPVQTVL